MENIDQIAAKLRNLHIETEKPKKEPDWMDYYEREARRDDWAAAMFACFVGLVGLVGFVGVCVALIMMIGSYAIPLIALFALLGIYVIVDID